MSPYWGAGPSQERRRAQEAFEREVQAGGHRVKKIGTRTGGAPLGVLNKITNQRVLCFEDSYSLIYRKYASK